MCPVCAGDGDASTGTLQQDAVHLFPGSGDMVTRMRAMDWSQTPLGAAEVWPLALRAALNICLTSRFPIVLFCGPDLRLLYNDAYGAILGPIKDLTALGTPGREVWAEIWDIVGPMLDGVMHSGVATWSDDQMLPMQRDGHVEEAYFNWSYSPIYDESGTVVGIFCPVTETTRRILSERRARVARDMAAALLGRNSTAEVCNQVTETLTADTADIPFVLLYRVDMALNLATLVSTSGITPGGPLSPQSVRLLRGERRVRRSRDPWSLAKATRDMRDVLITGISWEHVEQRARPDVAATSALTLPLAEPGQEHPTALLVVGISPHLQLDDEYREFYELIRGHVRMALAAAHTLAEEQRRAEALAEIDRAKTAFFSNVSHEFRTTLTLMLGPLQDLLTTYQHTSETRAQLELIQRNGVRLLKLVNTLLDFSRIEAGRVQASYQQTDLAAYTTELASNFRSLVERGGLELIVDCPPLAELKEPLYVDRDMWEKVVLNLLSNAFKFTFSGSITVMLRAIDGGRQAELVVRDTGVGIPSSDLPHVFERFYRVEVTQARTFEGSGIGLSLVRELVQLYGGTISIESVEGQGTTVVVRLPAGAGHLTNDRIQTGPDTRAALASTAMGAAPYVSEAESWMPEAVGSEDITGETLGQVRDAVAHPLDVSKATAAVQTTRIVVADDNADMREYLTRLLSARYTVEAVSTGADALDAVRRQTPALVLADVMMPVLDGFGMLRSLRADPRTHSIPVILLSARAGEEATVEGLEAGADDYLIKPFSARELLSRVAARLEIASMRTEAILRARELEAIFEAVTDTMGVFDADGHTIHENAAQREALVRVTQRPADTVRGRAQQAPLLDGRGVPISEDELPYIRIFRGESFNGRNALELTRLMLNGERRYFSVTGGPVVDEEGQIRAAVCITRDVTYQRRLERELAERAQRLEATFTAIPEAIILMDAEGRWILQNAEADRIAALTGAGDKRGAPTQERWKTAELRDARGEPLPQPVWPAGRVLRGETLTDADATDIRVRGTDGIDHDFLVTGSPVRGSNGGITGAVVLLREVTEQRALEHALRESERRYRALVETSALIVWTNDPQGNVIGRIPQWEAVTGVTGDHYLENHRWLESLHPDDMPRVAEAWVRALSSVEPIEVEYRLRTPDGAYRWILSRVAPVRDESGVVREWIGAASDIHERKMAEEELERRVAERTSALSKANRSLRLMSQRMLDIQESERRRIARELHDEIGQALTGVKMMIEMAERQGTLSSPPGMAAIDKAIEDMLTQVRELALELRPAILDNIGLLSALLWYINRYTEQTGIRVEFSHSGLDHRLAPEVEIGVYRLVQEALTNVARHADVQLASLRMVATADALTIVIADQGRGFHADAALAESTSIGLTSMRERVELLGGTLSITSLPGAGTTIVAELPLSYAHPT